MHVRRTRRQGGGRVAVEVFANLPSTTVSSGGTTAPAGGTTETWTVASSASFPAASSSAAPPTQFHVADAAANTEIIAVTNVSGTTWTVTRGAEGTTPVTHLAGFTVVQVASAGALTQLARVNWVNAVTQFGADPTGGTDATTAIQNALLSFGTLGSWSQGQGGVVYLPAGYYATSSTLIIPSGVWLVGDGWGTQLTLTTDSGCDMIQSATYNSASQAAILGVSAASIHNAFWWGVEKITLHGDAFHATLPAYRHGINITLNPTGSTGPGDPDFDPSPVIRDVRIEGCTGDGIYHSGRSGALFERVLVQYCNGNGFSPSFDTTLLNCLAEKCNTGFYLNHGSVVGAGCKSFNNLDYTWVSGHAYSPDSFGGLTAVAIDNGQMWFCISATSGTTAPHLDAAHWTAVSATSPQATGYGYYWDTGSAEHDWAAVDGQQNSTGDYYFKGPLAGPVSVHGSSSNPNFNNGQAAYNSANPNNYASVTFDGCSGVTASVNADSLGSGSSNAVLCTLLNSPSKNMLTASTDGSATTLFPSGIPAFALVDGKLYGLQMAGYLALAVVTLTDAATITVNAALGNAFAVTLTASGHTLGAPSNPVDGQVIRIRVIQDGTGSRTLSYNAVYDFGAAGTPTLSTTAAKVDILGFEYVASISKWCYLGSGLGF